MKKSTLLTVASVGAVALTSAMTFAAWDNLTASTTSDAVTFKQINVTKDAELSLTATSNDGLSSDYTPSATGDVIFKVAGLDSFDGTKMTFKATADQGGTNVTANCDIKIYEKTDDSKTDIITTGDSTVEASNAYTVVVTPKTGEADVTALADKPITVTVEATLTK